MYKGGFCITTKYNEDSVFIAQLHLAGKPVVGNHLIKNIFDDIYFFLLRILFQLGFIENAPCVLTKNLNLKTIGRWPKIYTQNEGIHKSPVWKEFFFLNGSEDSPANFMFCLRGNANVKLVMGDFGFLLKAFTDTKRFFMCQRESCTHAAF